MTTISGQVQTSVPAARNNDNLFAQAVQTQRQAAPMPKPTVNVTGTAATTTNGVGTTGAGVTVSAPVDGRNTRVGGGYTRTMNEGTLPGGRPVSNTIEAGNVSVSRPIGGVTVTGTLTREQNRNELTGRTTDTSTLRVSGSASTKIGPNTTLSGTGSVGVGASTPQGGDTAVTITPRASVGVTHQEGRVTLGATIDAGAALPGNAAGQAAIEAAGNGANLAVQGSVRVPVGANGQVTGTVRHGILGPESSANPTSGPFPPENETVFQVQGQITLP